MITGVEVGELYIKQSKRLHVEKQLGKTMKMLTSSYLQMM